MVSAGKPGIVSSLENAGRTTPEKALNPDVAPDLQSAKGFPKLIKGNKRRKSLDSSPNSQPNSKRKGARAQNSSEAEGSEEYKDLTDKNRTADSGVIDSEKFTDPPPSQRKQEAEQWP